MKKKRFQGSSAIVTHLLLLQVEELKTEMDVVSGEVQAQEEGYEKLKKVDRKLSSHHGCKKEDVQVLVEEIQSMQRTLFVKEQEKNDLVQALLRLKDKLSQPDSSTEVRSGNSLMHMGIMLASLHMCSLVYVWHWHLALSFWWLDKVIHEINPLFSRWVLLFENKPCYPLDSDFIWWMVLSSFQERKKDWFIVKSKCGHGISLVNWK